MLLTFKKMFYGNIPTYFKFKIQSGIKIHTIRLNNRWKPGYIINFWEGTPRNTQNDPAPFYLEKRDLASYWKKINPDQTKDGFTELPLCCAVEQIQITFPQLQRGQYDKALPETFKAQIQIGKLLVDELTLGILAMYDGFDSEQDMLRFFFLTAQKQKKYHLVGQLIHWKRSAVYDLENALIYNTIDSQK